MTLIVSGLSSEVSCVWLGGRAERAEGPCLQEVDPDE